jgi:hypothetical protein
MRFSQRDAVFYRDDILDFCTQNWQHPDANTIARANNHLKVVNSVITTKLSLDLLDNRFYFKGNGILALAATFDRRLRF